MPESKRAAIYARVSTTGQDPGLQLADLRRFQVDRGFQPAGEFVDVGFSGTKESRPELDRMMDQARKKRFDVVLVWRFDRFARSVQHLVSALHEFRGLGIGFLSFQENIDTTSPLGEAIFVIVAAMARLERDIIVERVKAGLRKAKADGRKLGRPKKLIDLERVRAMLAEGRSMRQVGKELGVDPATVRSALAGVKNNPSPE